MAEAPGFRVFVDWKRQLLERRELPGPDGRDLFGYRLSAKEFGDLERLLAEWLARLSKFELVYITRLTGFPGLFVLYAAEWWRRRFDGAHWSWEPILRAIGADPEEWNQFQRSECVRVGLQEWGLRPRATGGLRFLGSVAVQGGLPLRLLAEARGGIGRVIGTVFDLASGTAVTPGDLLTWVTSQQTLLPRSYRQDAIFALLADVAWTVLRLKDEALLDASADAIERLDKHVPGWRERFPLPVEDTYAQGLIEQLVREAASVRPQRQAVSLPVRRYVEALESGDWCLRSALALPDTITAAALANVLGVAQDDFPRFADLALTAGDNRRETTVRRMVGHEAYRIDRRPWAYADEVATYEHRLLLAAPDGRVWSAPAPRGEQLDDDLPWVFSTDHGTCELLRQGGGAVAPSEVLIALPTGWVARPLGGGDAARCGQLVAPRREIFRVRGAVLAEGGGGLACRIRTGQASASDESYEWRGERYWLDFQPHAMAFRGLPHLYRIGQDGVVQRVDGIPAWGPIGAAAPANLQPIGPVAVRYPAAGEVKHRARMLILPRAARLEVTARDARSGTLNFVDWGAVAARALTEGVVGVQSQSVGNALSLALSVAPGMRAPEQVQVEVRWRQTPTLVRIVLPFPAKGARAFDAGGRELASNSVLAAQELSGVRLVILGVHQNPRMSLEFTSSTGIHGRKHKLSAFPDAISAAVRLQDYAQDIQHLLSTDDSPDAYVHADLRIDGTSALRLRLARYAARLEKSGGEVCIEGAAMEWFTLEGIEALPVMALRLERPGDEPLLLQPCPFEGVARGCWTFLPEAREPGSWLIYPAQGARVPFRPLLWIVRGDVQCESRLLRAVSLMDQVEREAALDDAIAVMAADFRELSWGEVDRLVNQLGHLPLATLDIWRRLARSPSGMAAMALRFATLPPGFLERFALELPFIWEAVPFSAWKQAAACMQNQCVADFGSEAGAYVFRTHLDARVKDLAATHGALHFLLGLASADFISESANQSRALRALGHLAPKQLFEGEHSQVMDLRRKHADDDWPTGLARLLDEGRRRHRVGPLLCPTPYAFADAVINTPLLLAAQAAANETEYWFSSPAAVNALRENLAFDPEWFDEAYNLTIARCFAEGLLND